MGIFSSTLKPKTTNAKKQIFILSGQSNMAGRGGVRIDIGVWNGLVPYECQPDPSKIRRLNANLNWETAHVPLHADIDITKTCGVGPGMSFANAIKDHITGVIHLVPCAVGGTAISQWAKGEKLYENMVWRAKAAVKKGGEIKAMLWYQGGNDTTSIEKATSYKTNMENLIHNIRSDLGLPSLPIIQVAVESCFVPELLPIVREAQKSINLPNVICIDSLGLALKHDNLHLTTGAQVKLGHMFADAYLTNFVEPFAHVVGGEFTSCYNCCC
ncbi:probable carbohydrate esterase At4g34215 [Rutidosis leptorrhynchoides]|uniref:probable carbohydrate esterase At4g34215 n=1 Tax=Rutidosis leptorrhynchoides TaxID=125765 RepID=UPI003A9A4144